LKLENEAARFSPKNKIRLILHEVTEFISRHGDKAIWWFVVSSTENWIPVTNNLIENTNGILKNSAKCMVNREK